MGNSRLHPSISDNKEMHKPLLLLFSASRLHPSVFATLPNLDSVVEVNGNNKFGCADNCLHELPQSQTVGVSSI